ncbi:CPBP family intramembrane metalloprotease [Cellulophaga baltica]|uniref:CPBP family intramembrane glutamic endopeptidase n=1 Tax=Cellulophaga TaxID=104264 RepID=UPI001C070ED0|nr:MULTISPECIES: CPBP family intramembrane glutamic endopeptidase [Cellulophaga]MBU2996159.1 CPBP family intramembrane metalloprotease [Cellulophaga baltica]MDO6767554.1 CPBP family intramembrane metalloprotease [Cellulophaga sp. 1_MG-2023]
MIKQIWEFIKKPQYIAFHKNLKQEKFTAFTKILVLTIFTSFCLGILMSIIITATGAEIGNHGMDQLFEKYNEFIIFLLAVIFAPLLEELLFRAPLVFFKNSHFFKYAYYNSALLFGLIHLTNFESFTENIWLAPILVAPQIAAGFILGFTRVKLGLGWSILLHACHNGILIVPTLLLKLTGNLPD